MSFIDDFESKALSASQIAEMLDVSTQRVYDLPKTNPTFPKPYPRRLWGYLVVWDRKTVIEWAANHRFRTRRPKGKKHAQPPQTTVQP